VSFFDEVICGEAADIGVVGADPVGPGVGGVVTGGAEQEDAVESGEAFLDFFCGMADDEDAIEAVGGDEGGQFGVWSDGDGELEVVGSQCFFEGEQQVDHVGQSGLFGSDAEEEQADEAGAFSVFGCDGFGPFFVVADFFGGGTDLGDQFL